jgi:hypothetical protein
MVQTAFASPEAAAALRLTVLAPRSVLPDTPSVSVHAELVVKYHRCPDEKRLVELRPWGDRSQLMARCRGPREHETETRLLPMVHDAKRPPAVQALRCLGALFFGQAGLVPRILGEPDWSEATLLLQDDREDADERLLLQLALQVESRSSLRALVRQGNGSPPPSPASVAMRPGDADPLHALLRIALANSPLTAASISPA